MVRKQDVMNQHRKCVECELKVLNIPDDDAYKAPKRVRKDKCVKWNISSLNAKSWYILSSPMAEFCDES